MNKNERGYKCPACGMVATAVDQTSAFSSCIIRNRKCLHCGYTHETGEFPIDISNALLEAVSVLNENAVGKTELAER